MSIMSSVKSTVYQSQSSIVVKTYSGGKDSSAMKAGDFLLNGKKVAITKGDSLKSISEKINKLAPQTGVRARIVKKNDGYGLHLVSKNKPVGIQDPNGVLANLYSKGHIGKSSKHLIQVTGDEIFYNRPLPKSQQHSRTLTDMFKAVKPHNTEINPNTLVVLNQLLPPPVQLAPPPVQPAPPPVQLPQVPAQLQQVPAQLAPPPQDVPYSVSEMLLDAMTWGVNTTATVVSSVGSMLGFW